jgi:hypothetical protein
MAADEIGAAALHGQETVVLGCLDRQTFRRIQNWRLCMRRGWRGVWVYTNVFSYSFSWFFLKLVVMLGAAEVDTSVNTCMQLRVCVVVAEQLSRVCVGSFGGFGYFMAFPDVRNWCKVNTVWYSYHKQQTPMLLVISQVINGRVPRTMTSPARYR